MGSVVWMAVLGTMTALVVSGAGLAFTAQPLIDRVSEAGGEIRKAAGEARDTAHEARQEAEDEVEEKRQTAANCTPTLTTQARPTKADAGAVVDYLQERIDEVEEQSVPEECEPSTVYWL